MSVMMDGSGGCAISLSTSNGAGSGEDDSEVLLFFQSWWCYFVFLNGVNFFLNGVILFLNGVILFTGCFFCF
ncbi:hypothetical protein Hanom_Chr17g01589821 [Helianthus anomalus]